jgi:hypothetical protein
MAVPYELYIRFLASKGYDELEAVNSQLEELNLPEIKQSTLDTEWSYIDAVLPQAIANQIHSKSYSIDFLQWSKVLEIEDLWLFEKPFDKNDTKPLIKLVYDIHQDIALRTCINALLIKRVSHKDIAVALAFKYSTLLKEGHISIYERMFFNPSRMKRGDWRTYMSSLDGSEKKAYFSALTEPVDLVKTELELPSKVQVSDTLQWLLNKSYIKAKHYMDINTPEANREAREWIDKVVVLTDKYEKYRATDREDFANALQMEFEFVETPFETPDSTMLKEVSDRAKKLAEGQKDFVPEEGFTLKKDKEK